MDHPSARRSLSACALQQAGTSGAETARVSQPLDGTRQVAVSGRLSLPAPARCPCTTQASGRPLSLRGAGRRGAFRRASNEETGGGWRGHALTSLSVSSARHSAASAAISAVPCNDGALRAGGGRRRNEQHTRPETDLVAWVLVAGVKLGVHPLGGLPALPGDCRPDEVGLEAA